MATMDRAIKIGQEEMGRILQLKETLDHHSQVLQYAPLYLSLGWVLIGMNAQGEVLTEMDFSPPHGVGFDALDGTGLSPEQMHLGVRTGKSPRLVVVAIDEGESLHGLEYLGDWRAECIAQAGGGREQHFYVLPADWQAPPSFFLAPQAFVHGEDDVVRVPPSLDPTSGSPWQWLQPPWANPPRLPNAALLQVLRDRLQSSGPGPLVPSWEEVFRAISPHGAIIRALLGPAASQGEYYQTLLKTALESGFKEHRLLLGLLWHVPCREGWQRPQEAHYLEGLVASALQDHLHHLRPGGIGFPDGNRAETSQLSAQGSIDQKWPPPYSGTPPGALGADAHRASVCPGHAWADGEGGALAPVTVKDSSYRRKHCHATESAPGGWGDRELGSNPVPGLVYPGSQLAPRTAGEPSPDGRLRYPMDNGGQHWEATHCRPPGNSLPLPTERVMRAVTLEFTGQNYTGHSLLQSLAQLRGTLEAAVQALAVVAEMREPYASGHQQRVTRLACAIARGMGLEEEWVGIIRNAATLHDIGKIIVPAEILAKPSLLTPPEMDLVKNHPQVACDILQEVEFTGPVTEIIRQHHERLDGSGYPRGLTGGSILLEARILAVADVVEAMVSQRPYRHALGLEAALAIIARHQGVLYDAQVVQVCLRLFEEQQFSW